MNGKSKPYAILVFGAPMSGKTTFAEQFSARFNAPFLNLSELYNEHKRGIEAGYAKLRLTIAVTLKYF